MDKLNLTEKIGLFNS